MPLDRHARTPLYLQLYQQLRDQYVPDEFAHQRLWSIRKMAQNLGVSKTTVEQAYEQLLAEGYVYTVPGSGYFYHDIQHWPTTVKAPSVPVASPQSQPTVPYDFRYGVSERLKPSWNAWKKAVRAALRQAEDRQAALEPDAQGLWLLRQQLVRFLQNTRGVRCTADQIVITTDTKAGLSRLLSLISPGMVGIETPGYRGLDQLTASYGHQTINIPVTSTGIDLTTVERANPSVVYTTPAHQFPLGVVLPIAKRLSLLQWADEHHALIVEDDYDSEYRYNAHSLPALQSLATADQVAYLGTFSRGIDSGLRMGYLVLPRHLVSRYHELYQYRSAMVPELFQQAMVNYFEDGSYYRHISRSRALNRQKYRLLCSQLAKTDRIEPIATGAGVHLVVRIPGIPQAQLMRQLVKRGVRIYPLDSNWPSMPSHDYYLLGFGGLSLAQLATATQHLVSACESLIAD